MKRLTLASSALLLVAGCSSINYAEHHFVSTDELARASGWNSCSTSDERKTREMIGQYGFLSEPCSGGAVIIWASDAKRQESHAQPWNALEAGECRIDGGNWTVTGTQYAVEDTQKRLGGAKTCA